MFSPLTTTGIGSLPHTDPDEACRLILGSLDIPFWPQLPALSFRESMILQFSEGMPSLHIDQAKQTLFIEKNDEDLTRFYQSYSEKLSLPISEGYAQGLPAFIRSMEGLNLPCVKGQTTGPLTFALGLKTREGQSIFFDEELREISLIVLKAKARWQTELLLTYASKVVMFVDEPILSALGTSAYLGVSAEESLRLLTEITGEIMTAGGIPGIHCCGKADWPLIIKSGARIVNFDAYEFLESVSLFPAEFTAFLENGGFLAWGIVPTTDAIRNETVDSLADRFCAGMERLSKMIPYALLRKSVLLSPSCGAGSLTIQEAEKVFTLLSGIKRLLRDRLQ